MPSDEWGAKARKIYLPLTFSTPTESRMEIRQTLASVMREAYQRGRNESDTAAERRGIERAAKVARKIEQRADRELKGLSGGDSWHYTDGMADGACEIRVAIEALAPPMADAGPTEPAAPDTKGD